MVALRMQIFSILLAVILQGNQDAQEQLEAALQHAQQVEQQLAEQQQQAAETLQAAEEVSLHSWTSSNTRCCVL